MQQLIYQLRYALPLWLVGILTDWWPDNRVTIRIRGTLCRPFFKSCGPGFTVARRITFLNSSGIEIGPDVYIATGAWIDGIGGVTIGAGVKISPYVVIASSRHCFKNGRLLLEASQTGPVRIGAGCWLASHVVVAAGSSVGDGCLIAANAAVVRDIPASQLAGGVPAKPLGPVPEWEPDIQSRFNRAELR